MQITRDAVSYTAIYPEGTRDSLVLSGIFGRDTITDARGDNENPRPIAIINTVRKDATTALGGTETQLSTGSSGFWGLGLFLVSQQKGRS